MLYQLPTPIAEQTHAKINYVEIRPDVSIEVAGVLGTMGKETFLPFESFNGLTFRRTIEGDELKAFTAEAEKAGMSWEKMVLALAAWLDRMGLEKSRFADIKAEAVAAAPALEAKP